MLITILEQGEQPNDIQTAKEIITQDFDSYIEEARKDFVDQEDRKITLLQDKRINKSSQFFQYFVRYSNGDTKTINQYIMCIDTTLDFTKPSNKEQKQSQEQGIFIPQSLLDYSIPRKLKPILSYANDDKKLDSLSNEELTVLNRAYDFITTIHTAGTVLDMCRNLDINADGQHGTFNLAVRSTHVEMAQMGHRVTTTYHSEVIGEKD